MMHQNRDQGRAVDDFLTAHTCENFDYVECIECHSFQDAINIDFSKWRFSIMGLKPSILRVAKGLCPICIDNRKLFKGLLDRIDHQ
jgi:hypothetical protein